MAKIKFNYNIKKDAWSWVLIAKEKNMWGLNWHNQIAHIPEELLKKIEKVSFSYAQKIVENYIIKNLKREYKNTVMQLEMQALEKSWRIVEKKYFNILSKITQKPIYINELGCYYTTGFVCPYNKKENWFMVSMWHSIPFSITTICHEVMHLQFLFYYSKYLKKKGLNENQIENLKEGLTVILNEPEFKDIILCNDVGYPDHQGLRKKLQKIWKKNKNFQIFLEKAIAEIKK